MYGGMYVRRANNERLANEAHGWWGEAPERTKTLHKANGIPAKRHGLGRYAAEPRP